MIPPRPPPQLTVLTTPRCCCPMIGYLRVGWRWRTHSFLEEIFSPDATGVASCRTCWDVAWMDWWADSSVNSFGTVQRVPKFRCPSRSSRTNVHRPQRRVVILLLQSDTSKRSTNGVNLHHFQVGIAASSYPSKPPSIVHPNIRHSMPTDRYAPH